VRANEFTATARGYSFTFHLSPGGKNSPSHTYVHVKTRPFDVLLGLTKERDTTRKQRAGYVDIDVGDPDFDAAWVVEGAPLGRVRRLLADAKLRERLTSAAGQLRATIQVEDGELHFSREGYDYASGVVATGNLELLLDLADAVMAESALPSPDAPLAEGDYRSAAGKPTDDRTADRGQILELKRQRAARSAASVRPILFIAPILVVGFTTAFLALSHAKWPPLARAFPLLTLGMFLFAMRGAWMNYVAQRRTAGLPFDYAPFMSFAVVLGVAVAGYLGAFGF
jgi:hypothetical protein